MKDQETGLLSPYLRRQRINAVKPFLKGKVLDFGCGAGHLSKIVKGEYYGVELDDNIREYASNLYPSEKFLSVDEAMQSNVKYNSICMLAVLEHISEPVDWLKQLLDKLDSNGVIIITVPNPRFEFLHELGAKIGIVSAEADEEHVSDVSFRFMNNLAQKLDLEIALYKKFLFGMNQLCILRKKSSSAGVVDGNFYNKYESSNPIAKFLTQRFIDSVYNLASLVSDQVLSLTEIGCGEGYILSSLVKLNYKSVTAFDISKRVVDIAKQRLLDQNIDFSVKNVYDLSTKDSADLIVCCEVLEHLDDPEMALSLISSFAGKYCIISVPNEPLWRFLNICRFKYLKKLGNTPGHINHWSPKQFQTLVADHFEIVKVLKPIPWQIYLVKKNEDS